MLISKQSWKLQIGGQASESSTLSKTEEHWKQHLKWTWKIIKPTHKLACVSSPRNGSAVASY